MELIRPGTRIEFMKYRKFGFGLSLALVLVSLVSIFFIRGLNYGIDFEGGTEILVNFSLPVNTADVRGVLASLGYPDARIQKSFGEDHENEFFIRIPKDDASGEDMTLKIEHALKDAFGKEQLEILRAESVGSEVSKDLKEKGILSLLYVGIGILIYIWWRFELRFSMGAILALIHDIVITVGVFSILGKEITLPIIAALLTIIGYSLNDTIVVFDRIRENIKKTTGTFNLAEVMNDSLSQTLNRTILTSLTVFIVVFCLFIMGGSVIHDFAFAMMVGVVIGTYSSIFIASPTLLLFERRK
ncbi:MAG TPA: protein translocase subunit SecF [Deltaproteobacteria bacterium]|nr:protein translocase subunit SecF [Deltaproteobacteria bacterium]